MPETGVVARSHESASADGAAYLLGLLADCLHLTRQPAELTSGLPHLLRQALELDLLGWVGDRDAEGGPVTPQCGPRQGDATGDAGSRADDGDAHPRERFPRAP